MEIARELRKTVEKGKCKNPCAFEQIEDLDGKKGNKGTDVNKRGTEGRG